MAEWKATIIRSGQPEREWHEDGACSCLILLKITAERKNSRVTRPIDGQI